MSSSGINGPKTVEECRLELKRLVNMQRYFIQICRCVQSQQNLNDL